MFALLHTVDLQTALSTEWLWKNDYYRCWDNHKLWILILSGLWQCLKVNLCFPHHNLQRSTHSAALNRWVDIKYLTMRQDLSSSFCSDRGPRKGRTGTAVAILLTTSNLWLTHKKRMYSIHEGQEHAKGFTNYKSLHQQMQLSRLLSVYTDVVLQVW